MQIDTEVDPELPTDHPVFGELNQTERAIYWSALEGASDAVASFEEFVEENGELDPEARELSQPKQLLQDSLALTEMMDELAEWRRTSITSKNPDDSTEECDE